jgi:hypothetical protein
MADIRVQPQLFQQTPSGDSKHQLLLQAQLRTASV